MNCQTNWLFASTTKVCLFVINARSFYKQRLYHPFHSFSHKSSFLFDRLTPLGVWIISPKTFPFSNEFNLISIASFHFLANHLFACMHSLIELIHDPHFDSHNHSFHCALISYENVVNIDFILVPSYSIQGIICNLLRSLHFHKFQVPEFV